MQEKRFLQSDIVDMEVSEETISNIFLKSVALLIKRENGYPAWIYSWI